MDRTALVVVTCCIAGLFAWYFYFAKQFAPVAAPAPVAVAASTSPTPAASPLVTSGKPEVVTDRKEAAPAPTPSVPEEKMEVVTPQIRLTFTNLGGGILEAEPLGKEHLAEDGLNVTLNHAGEIPIGAISGKPGEDTALPYVGTREGNTVRYERTDAATGLKITKEYTLDYQGDEKQIPAVRLKVIFTNTGTQPYKDGGYYIYAGSAAPIHRRDQPSYLSFDWFTDGHYHTDHATSFDASHVPLVNYETHPGRAVITEPIGKAAWVAVKNQFYTTIVAPIPATVGEEAATREIWARRFDLALKPEEKTRNEAVLHGLDAALGMPALQIDPGQSVSQSFQIYAGPKFYARLDKLGHYEQEVMDFGKFKAVSILLLGMMNVFHGWFGSYALAIILLTILVKAVLFPLQNKANKSMKRMSVLSPQIATLREKYKDDPTRMNAETMKLYRANGMSPLAPLGGCWPMLIQMPIFFGFLYMLYTAAELRNSSFLWVHDLSQPDTVARFNLPFALPIIGSVIAINVLPLLMLGTQFWQMRLMPRTGDPAQQKMMMFMPLIFGFICYNFAAALALYYSVQNLLTILQLYITRTQNPPATDAGGGAAKFVPVKGTGGGRSGAFGFGSSANFGKGGKRQKG